MQQRRLSGTGIAVQQNQAVLPGSGGRGADLLFPPGVQQSFLLGKEKMGGKKGARHSLNSPLSSFSYNFAQVGILIKGRAGSPVPAPCGGFGHPAR